MSFFDAIAVGETLPIGSHTFTAAAIKAFAAKYDPQPFHLDEEAARASVLGGLCASGWHTAAVFMRLNVEHLGAGIARLRAEGRPVPEIGPSPGITNLRWLRPVYAGDTIAFSSTATAKRLSASRPGWGIVEAANVGVDAAGRTVFSVDTAGFFGLK